MKKITLACDCKLKLNLFIVFLFFNVVVKVQAQCSNLLTNGGFEDITTGLINGDNLFADISPWISSGGVPSIVRVDGAGGYDYPAPSPEEDTDATTGAGVFQHYFDIFGSTTIYQTFTLSTPSTITYSGYFSTRDNLNGQGSISIYNGIGTAGIVEDTSTVLTIISNGDSTNTPWFFVQRTVSLAAGTYSYAVFMNQNINFDGATVNAVPSAPVVSTPVTYCVGATSSALTATGSNLLWYTVSSGGTGSAIAPTPSTATAGNTSYYVSQSVNGCESSRSEIVVTVNAVPSAPVVSTPVTYCVGAPASALTATGSNLLWYTVSSGGTGSAIAPTPSTVTPGNTSYYVSQSVNGCESSRSEIVVTVNAVPSAPVVSTPVTYCVGATASALTATGSNLLWYTVSSGGTGSAIAPTPSTVTPGNTSYYVSQSVNGCESSRSEIVVTVNAVPSAPVVSTPVTYCIGATASALTATGSNLLWYTVSSGGTGSAIAPTPSTVTPGNTSYYVSQSVSGCESSRSEIVVTVNAVPSTPLVSTPVTYCVGATASALTATGSNLLWYTVSSGGTGSTIAPTPSTATAGNISYYVSQSVSGCESSRSEIVVTVNAVPSAPVVSTPVTYCVGAPASALTATGSNLLWYTVSSGGIGSAIAPTPSTVTAGNTSYYVSQSVSGCESSRSEIVVTVNAVPSAPVVSTPVTYCIGATASALTATGSNLLWYTVSSGGTGSTIAPTPSTATAGNTSYYVSQSVSGCESSRSEIVVTVNLLPTINITNPPTCLANSTSYSLEVTVSSGNVTSTSGIVSNISGNVWNIRGVTSETDIDVTVTEVTGCQETVSINAPLCVTDIANLDLTKTGEYIDENGNGITDAGDQIEYTFTVENTGAVDVTNIVLVDDLSGIEVFGGPIDLAVGEIDTDSFTATYILTEDDIISGMVTNQALVMGVDLNGRDVIDISDDPFDDTDVDMDNDGDFEDETVLILASNTGITIYTGMSPNGDGVNDEFRIIGLNNFPENTLQIFNRWGVKIFERDRYEQSGVKLFDGISEGRVTVQEEEKLPVGTYYYMLEYKNASGTTMAKAGYFYITR
ncbi:gliding motility-associated C-terminal domain-containing protein [Aquimarina sp. AU58]|uniref:Ig-like domain-containing protein n=1 Tax=Aquimarina sp. AU58 TaxID=1874112 RepID=UPI000D6E75F9|nr:gliding motility-associated C-terminal domain-containing protein [Aquimarina sp. AU58]